MATKDWKFLVQVILDQRAAGLLTAAQVTQAIKDLTVVTSW